MAAMLTTGQIAEAAGVSRKALRVYEERGLLSPERGPQGYRCYSRTEVEVAVFIRRARALGLGLDGIAGILAVGRSGQAPCAEVRGLLDERLAEIDAAIADLRALRTTLEHARTTPPADPVGDSGAICPIIDGSSGRCGAGGGTGGLR
ncbi:DNA-binding transcriptional MerR regulator [Spinactinospora alkalitolerans]|uniref:DNA-binding transcriptional MerR regulator n=1 Tax=Spinactinospora alkalitolerans TaxID=687207 RepID=A0A852TZ51_9ACTN|nr:MerR family DNA-binding protein [Spinactinospora alkalitolerans]NYE47080.1 DNA-binding transcriptional MerR regulator [Spinactinospora alkalitolerans]